MSFKIKHLTFKEMPLYTEMREQLKEDECWDELQKLDYNGQFLSLRYKEDKALIDEVIDAIKTQHWELDKTEIRFLKENRSEYFSGTGNDIKMILKYIGS